MLKSKDNGMKGEHDGKYWEIFCFSFFSNFHLRQVLIKAEQSENKDCAFHNYLRCAVLLQMFLKNSSTCTYFSIMINLEIMYYYPDFRHEVRET